MTCSSAARCAAARGSVLARTPPSVGSGGATTCASIHCAGGLFFSTGGYASLLQVVNAPRHVPGGEAALVTRR
ncbi:hypothetical protein [Streptomyces sp. NPDC004284]|uniref:hypothetical protein n=1 Tax=Streptomyces sp. NPDC004284 TaxID=3364695 RepID=UPI00367AC6FD